MNLPLIQRQQNFTKLFEEKKSLILNTWNGPDIESNIRSLEGYIQSVLMDPNLMECHPNTILVAILEGFRLGINFNPNLNEGWIIPFKSKNLQGQKYPKVAQFVLGYKGVRKLVMNTGFVKELYVTSAFTGEQFEVQQGTQRNIIHTPSEKVDRTLENLIASYAIIKFKDGMVDFHVLYKKDYLQRIAKLPHGGKTDSHKNHPIAMAQKMAMTLLCRAQNMEIAPDVSAAIAGSDNAESGYLSTPLDAYTILNEEIPSEVMSLQDQVKTANNAAIAKGESQKRGNNAVTATLGNGRA